MRKKNFQLAPKKIGAKFFSVIFGNFKSMRPSQEPLTIPRSKQTQTQKTTSFPNEKPKVSLKVEASKKIAPEKYFQILGGCEVLGRSYYPWGSDMFLGGSNGIL